MMKRELQSLTGILQHATKVIVPSRAFMRSLHALQSVGSSPAHKVRLNLAARAGGTCSCANRTVHQCYGTWAGWSQR